MEELRSRKQKTFRLTTRQLGRVRAYEGEEDGRKNEVEVCWKGVHACVWENGDS